MSQPKWFVSSAGKQTYASPCLGGVLGVGFLILASPGGNKHKSNLWYQSRGQTELNYSGGEECETEWGLLCTESVSDNHIWTTWELFLGIRSSCWFYLLWHLQEKKEWTDVQMVWKTDERISPLETQTQGFSNTNWFVICEKPAENQHSE